MVAPRITFLAIFALLLSFCSSEIAIAAANHSQVNVLNYATTNVTTSAYVELVASTPVSISTLVVCDSSGRIMTIATGASGSEVDRFTTYVSSCVLIPIFIPQGSRLSIIANGTSATTGLNTVSFVQ